MALACPLVQVIMIDPKNLREHYKTEPRGAKKQNSCYLVVLLLLTAQVRGSWSEFLLWQMKNSIRIAFPTNKPERSWVASFSSISLLDHRCQLFSTTTTTTTIEDRRHNHK